jgi:iron complex outermembrane receptor protein
LFKANGAKGYRAPNITEVASSGLDPGAHILYLGNRNFVPEYNVQEDVELHGDFEWIKASVSLFNNQVHHFIYLARAVDPQGIPLVLEGGNKVYQYQQAEAQLYGLESSLEIYPFGKKGLRISHDFSLVYGFHRGAAFRDKGIWGEFLPLIPPRKGLTQWVMPVRLHRKYFVSSSIRVEMEAFGTQNRYLALDETESRTPGYTLWNAGFEFEILSSRKKGIQCQFQVNNLFDRSYQSGLSRLKYFEYYKQSPNGHLGIDGMGRNVCFKFIVPI